MTAVGADIGLIRAVRLAGPGAEFLATDEPVDLHLDSGTIVDIAPTGVLPARGEVLDAEGTWAVPGLWDNHVHSVQWALASERAQLGGMASAAEVSAHMADVAPLADGRRIGTGFRDALWPDAPSLELLDAATGGVPTYLINADVHSVWLNSAALRQEGFASPDGMLREEDAFEISRRLNGVDPEHADRAVLDAGRRAAARGITGLVDFDMAWNADAWARRAAIGFAAHRVEFAVYPVDLERAVAEGLRSGDVLTGSGGLVRVGSLKLITDGSLGTRTAACSHEYPQGSGNFGALNVAPEELIDLLTRAAGTGFAAAVHAIGDVAVSSALDGFAQSGASGSLEHLQLVRHADLARIARLGIIASVQPQHAVDDRDVVDEYWAEQTAVGYPLTSLLTAGAELRFGSDAPVAPLDPWQAIAAAVTRTDDERSAWRPEERISVEDALRASVRTSLRPGETADIALCAADPRSASAPALRSMHIAATLLRGRLTHEG